MFGILREDTTAGYLLNTSVLQPLVIFKREPALFYASLGFLKEDAVKFLNMTLVNW